MTEYLGNTEIPEQHWENYGDINPIENGGIWIKPDVPTFPGCFYVVEAVPMQDKYGWFLSYGYVDIKDDWIGWTDVCNWSDISWADEPLIKAKSAFSYYGPEHFGGECDLVFDRKELIEKLKFEGIEI